MKKEDYLDTLAEQIRYKKARGPVTEEICSHIEDQKEEFLKEGMEEEEAEEMAVMEMGDPVAAGIELDMIHRPKMAWGMIVLIGILSAAGLILQYLVQLEFSKTGMSASYPDMDGTAYILGGSIQKSILTVFLGLAVMAFVCYVDYSRIGLWAKEIIIFLFLGILILKEFAGVTVNGTENWVRFGPLALDCCNLLFLCVPLYGAALYSYRGKGYRGILIGVIWMLPPVWIALRTSSIITAMLLFITFMVALTAAVARGWFKVRKGRTIAAMWTIAALLPVCLYLLVSGFGAPYQADRLHAYGNYFMRYFGVSDADGGTGQFYMMDAVHQMISNSRLLGAGGLPDSAASMMRQSGSYMLTYVVSFYGVLAAAAIAGAVVFVFCSFFRISLKQKNQLGMIMGLGCSTVFIVQIMFYIISNLGIMPAETNCPFLSYGANGTVVMYVLVGMLLSIYRYQNILPISPPSRRIRLHGKKSCC